MLSKGKMSLESYLKQLQQLLLRYDKIVRYNTLFNVGLTLIIIIIIIIIIITTTTTIIIIIIIIIIMPLLSCQLHLAVENPH